MNLMRKLIGSGSNAASSRSGGGMLYEAANAASSSPNSGASQADYTLGLMHLRKLFGELKSQGTSNNQKELENMLYNMLPLFCKVCFSLFHQSGFVVNTGLPSLYNFYGNALHVKNVEKNNEGSFWTVVIIILIILSGSAICTV